MFGQVQGVLFRHSARMRAERLDITGLVKNDNGGSVVIIAEGGEESLNQFIEWCRHGPPLASVDELKIEWQGATGEFKDFEIL